MPEELRYLWEVFSELSMSRQEGGPIPFQDIYAYSMLMRADFAPWEVRILKHLDALWLRQRWSPEHD